MGGKVKPQTSTLEDKDAKLGPRRSMPGDDGASSTEEDEDDEDDFWKGSMPPNAGTEVSPPSTMREAKEKDAEVRSQTSMQEDGANESGGGEDRGDSGNDQDGNEDK